MTDLKIPTDGSQTSWLFKNMTNKLNEGLQTEKQLQLNGQSGTWVRDHRISSPTSEQLGRSASYSGHQMLHIGVLSEIGNATDSKKNSHRRKRLE